MTKGVLLIAMGVHYSRLAFNLTKTIKKHNPGLKVAAITDCEDDFILDEFDEVLKPELEHYVEEFMFNPFMLKTWIYDYSPFDKTIYLDVDTVCLRNFEELFEGSFKIQEVQKWNEQNWDKCAMVWVKQAGKKLQDLYEAYELPFFRLYPEYNSSFIMFEKSEENKKYFNQAKKNYLDRRLEFKPIGGRYPDELAFNLASAQHQQYSHKASKKPMYFQWENKKLPFDQIEVKYFFLGMAGGHHSSHLRRLYEMQVKKLSPFWQFDSRKKIFHDKK